MSGVTHAETIAAWLASTTPENYSRGGRGRSRVVARRLRLCVAARREPYVRATLTTVDPGPSTAIGHAGGRDAFGGSARQRNAAHGEDFDAPSKVPCPTRARSSFPRAGAGASAKGSAGIGCWWGLSPARAVCAV